jgi:hypothetical protein
MVHVQSYILFVVVKGLRYMWEVVEVEEESHDHEQKNLVLSQF